MMIMRGKTLWHIACIIVLWVVWQERNVKIFEEKCRMEGMLFISTLLFELLVLSLLEEFHLMFIYLIGFRFVIWKGWIMFERVWLWFLRYFVHAFINISPYIMEEILLPWLGFVLCGKDLSSFSSTLLLSIYILFLIKKMAKKILNGPSFLPRT